MNYFEAVKFLDDIDKYNKEKISFLLGENPSYLLSPLFPKSESILLYDTELFDRVLNFKCNLRMFALDDWDVIAYSSTPINDPYGVREIPTIQLSKMYYKTTLTETNLGIRALELRTAYKNTKDFWCKEIFENASGLL